MGLSQLHLDPSLMDLLRFFIEKACVLVTIAFLLTRASPSRHPFARRWNGLGPALLFLALGIAEVLVTKPHGQGALSQAMNLRIVAAAAAGLIAGPWIGTFIGIAVTVIAVLYSHQQTAPIAISMIAAGLAGGLLHDLRASIAARPSVGFVVGVLTSLLRDGLNVTMAYAPLDAGVVVTSALIHGCSVLLILLVLEQARRREENARAAAVSELRALQARMNPHFLFNSLNTLSALSQQDPDSVPRATASLGHFLRSSLDQHEQATVSLREEMEVVDAYLEIEALRMGSRLNVERSVDPRLLAAQIPPFLVQPLVENAVLHGIQPKPGGGTIRIDAQAASKRLVLTVSDTGAGMTTEQRERIAHPERGRIHALTILRRRLDGLYGSRFVMTVEHRNGSTTARVEIPLEGVAPLPLAMQVLVRERPSTAALPEG